MDWPWRDMPANGKMKSTVQLYGLEVPFVLRMNCSLILFLDRISRVFFFKFMETELPPLHSSLYLTSTLTPEYAITKIFPGNNNRLLHVFISIQEVEV